MLMSAAPTFPPPPPPHLHQSIYEQSLRTYVQHAMVSVRTLFPLHSDLLYICYTFEQMTSNQMSSCGKKWYLNYIIKYDIPWTQSKGQLTRYNVQAYYTFVILLSKLRIRGIRLSKVITNSRRAINNSRRAIKYSSCGKSRPIGR
jgi:hypothetical protein